MSERITAVIVAAGKGRRFGGLKHEANLAGRPVLERTLEAFDSHPEITDLLLVLNPTESSADYTSLYAKLRKVVPGGEKRQDAVRNGLDAADSDPRDIILVHDGARPLVTAQLISSFENGLAFLGRE